MKHLVWVAPFISFLVGYSVSYVMLQKKAIETPRVVGKSLQESMEILSKHSLSGRLLRAQDDAVLAEGTVLDQIPRAGLKIRPNQHVFLVIAKKPPKDIVPECVGKRLDTLIAPLKKQGIEVISIATQSYYPEGSCIAQDPWPGSSLTHKKVTCLVSAGTTKLAIVPDFKGKHALHVQTFLRDHKIQHEMFHPTIFDTGHHCDRCVITDQRPMAGSIVDLDKSLFFQLQAGAM